MKIVESDEKLVRISFSGKLDSAYVSNNDIKFFALLNSIEAPVVLDFLEVSFLGSLGIRMILMGLKQVQRQGFTLKIANAGPNIRNVFEMTSLGDLLI